MATVSGCCFLSRPGLNGMADRKRILVFSTAYLPLMGGAEVAIREITDRATEFEFDLVCARLKPRITHLASRNVRVHRVGFGLTIDKYLLPFLGPLVALRLYGLRGPDLLWSMQASYGGFASLFYSWLRPRVRFLLTVQEGDPPERYAKHAGPFRVLHRAIFRRADQIQAISRYLCAWATEMGFQGTPVLIPNGVDVTRFVVSACRMPHTAHREVRIVSVSRLSHKNGLDLLIGALSLLPERVKLDLIGEGEDRVKLEALAAELGVRERVRFLGNKNHEEVAKAFQESDIFCRPSRTEGLGNAFLEAMAAGLPTIGTAVGGIPDFLTDGETGWVCAPEDPATIADAIGLVMATPKEEIGRITYQAARIARVKYNWDMIGKDMAALFAYVIASKRLLIATGIYPPEIGGPAKYVPLLADGLVKAGDRVTVVTYGDRKTETGRGWSMSVVPRTGPTVWRYARFFFRMLRLASRQDLVFAQTPSADGFPACLAAAIRRKPFALKIVGDYAWEFYSQIANRKSQSQTELLDEFLEKRHEGKTGMLERMERFTAKRASSIIVPSAYLASVVRRWGMDQSRIHIIYNAVPTVPSSAERNVLRRNFGIENNRVLFTVARCVPWKGVDFLLDVLADLSAATIFVIAGDGPMKATWEQQAHNAELDSRVRFLGSVPAQTVADWNVAADAFVLASAYEGYPHVVVEALTAGRPCFVSDKAGNKEMGALVPGAVHVLPYRDRAAWVAALSEPFSPVDPSTLRLQTVERLLQETREILHAVCAF